MFLHKTVVFQYHATYKIFQIVSLLASQKFAKQLNIFCTIFLCCFYVNSTSLISTPKLTPQSIQQNNYPIKYSFHKFIIPQVIHPMGRKTDVIKVTWDEIFMGWPKMKVSWWNWVKCTNYICATYIKFPPLFKTLHELGFHCLFW